jgi:RNAse (barnase) inhibitor barstar
MCPFPETDDDRWVFHFLKNGSVVKYWQPTLLEQDCLRLEAIGYQVDRFNCLEWVDEATMHKQFKERLGFPDYYGKNLDAFNDCISWDIHVPDRTGRALVLNRFDAFYAIEPRVAWHILDMVARSTYRHLVRGRRFFVFLQSDDPQFDVKHVGCPHIQWNGKESMNKARGL